MSLARAVLVGTLDQDAEQRFTPQNVAVTTSWLVVPGRPMPNGSVAPATRVKLTCWRGMAETASQLQKGQIIMVEGKLMVPSYQGQDGVKKNHFELEVSSIAVMPALPTVMTPPAGSATGGNAMASAPKPAATLPVAAAATTGHDDMGSDLYTVEDIPF
jgi:single-strand DNA-binding protein